MLLFSKIFVEGDSMCELNSDSSVWVSEIDMLLWLVMFRCVV